MKESGRVRESGGEWEGEGEWRRVVESGGG